MEGVQAAIDESIHDILVNQNDLHCHSENILHNLRILRNLCARGSEAQLQIAVNEDLREFMSKLLLATEDINSNSITENLRTVGWQLLANMTVNNQQTLTFVWTFYGKQILQWLMTHRKLERSVDVILMILYNVMKASTNESLVDLFLVMKAVLAVWRSIVDHLISEQFDFLHIIFEEFLVKNGRNTVKYYAHLNTDERLTFLNYLHNYLQQNNPNGLIHTFIIQHISKEFKIKSDSILRVASLQEVDKMNPLEAYALLRCIASASGSESYTEIYFKDNSLFLNVSSLLRCVVAASENSSNALFSPMNKLEEVAPTSNIPADYQSEISFELKTLLVRCIANLLYNNNTNKGYCLDTELLPVLFECTKMDARNPLMKEWSILAIRNACIGCPEIQQVIANMTQQGPASNDILTELNLDMGSLRINPSK